MLSRIILFESVLLAFSGFTGYAIVVHGYSGFLTVATSLSASVWGIQLMLDFALALGLMLYWMSSNAKERGIVFWPFAVLTLTLGSIGPLGYFAWREWRLWLEGRSSCMAEASHQRA